MATTTNCSKLAHSSSIIVLLVAVALALAPIAHQSDFHISHMQNMIGPSDPSEAGVIGHDGGRHDPISPPCRCSYDGACPWCHGGVKNVHG
ncbi:unnamed protein product [Urochloa humidicola]